MKTLTELKDELQERLDRNYGADIKMVPTGKPGEAGYRKVRARALTWQIPDDPRGIEAPQVGDIPSQDTDRGLQIFNKYYKKYLSKIQNPNTQSNNIRESVEEPPVNLILKRISIRDFQNNVKVGLYYCEFLKRYFTIPYGKGVSKFQSEEFNNLNIIIDIFNNLNEEQQVAFIDTINNNEDFLDDIINKFK